MTNRPVWDDRPWRGFPPLTSHVEADLCVIGLGGSGLAAVDEGLKAGLDVVGVDAGSVAGEAAGRNGGFLLAGLPLFYHEAVQRWGPAAATIYQRTLDELEVIMVGHSARQVGSIRVAGSDEEVDDISAELVALRDAGFEAEAYEGTEGQGLLLRSDGVCNPMQRCRSLALDLSRSGARLFENTRAIDWESGVVETAVGRVSAENILICVDGRLEMMFPDIPGLKTARLEMLATEPVAPMSSYAVYSDFGYNYWQQLPDGSLALGGQRHRHMEESWTTKPGSSELIQSSLDTYLRSSLGVGAAVTHRWAGHAAFTRDRTPVFSEVDPGVLVVGGYSGHGNVLGAVYGRAGVRALVSGDYTAPL